MSVYSGPPEWKDELDKSVDFRTVSVLGYRSAPYWRRHKDLKGKDQRPLVLYIATSQKPLTGRSPL